MKAFDHIVGVFEDAAAARLESALMHACIAIDGAAKAKYPSEVSVGRRYVRFLRDNYWLLEPMMGVGFNFEKTRFENLVLPRKPSPDFADVIYDVLRCRHAHCDEVPPEFEVTQSIGGFSSFWEMGPNILRMPDRIIWALTSAVVLTPAHGRLRGQGGARYFSLGDEKFPIADWWGREADFRPIAARWNTTRVKVDGLGQMRGKENTPRTAETTHSLLIVSKPP